MKKILIIFVSTALLFSSCNNSNIIDNSYISCGSISSSHEDIYNSTEEATDLPPGMPSMNSLDLQKYVASIQDAESLRIKKNLLNDSENENNNEQELSQTLVKTVTTYESGVAVGEEDIEVFFKRIDTTTTTHLLVGEDTYFPYEDGVNDDETIIYSISFSSYEGFVYRVFNQSGELIKNDITDNCSDDDNNAPGIIKISHLEKDEVYTVKYSGYGYEEVLTQEELLGAVIDKIYVYSSRFSFISFVPEGYSSRPNDNDLVIGIDGVADYDKNEYYSSNTRQSFVIDNYSGLVYKIENLVINRFDLHVLYVINDGNLNLPCGFKINDNNELEIFRIVRNHTIKYTSIFGDKYNQYYVMTNDFSGTDYDNKTIYFTSNDTFIHTHEGYVLKAATSITFTFTLEQRVAFDKISKLGPGFEEQNLTDDEEFNINSQFAYNLYLSRIKDGFLYTYISGKSYIRFPINPAPFDEEKASQYWGYLKPSCGTKIEISSNYSSDDYTIIHWSRSDNLALIYSNCRYEYDSSSDIHTILKQDYFSLCFFYIWEVENNESGAKCPCCVPATENQKSYINYDDSRNVLLENCVLENQNGILSNDPVFKQVTFSETIYYKVVYDKGYPEVVNMDTYIAPDNEVAVIQPISR